VSEVTGHWLLVEMPVSGAGDLIGTGVLRYAQNDPSNQDQNQEDIRSKSRPDQNRNETIHQD
jgi:hypothetical protein